MRPIHDYSAPLAATGRWDWPLIAPADRIRFTPKATKLLRRPKMTRCADFVAEVF